MDYYSREYIPGEYDAEEYLEAAQMIDPEKDFSDWSLDALRAFVEQHQS